MTSNLHKKHCQATMYAIDITIYCCIKIIDNLVTTINNELVPLEERLNANKLSLNVVKTQAIMIGSQLKVNRSNHPTVPVSP